MSVGVSVSGMYTVAFTHSRSLESALQKSV